MSRGEEVAACDDDTFDDVFAYAARLTADRALAEDLVSEAYMALVRAGRDGSVSSIGGGLADHGCATSLR